MKVHCSYDALVNAEDIKPHPKNRNQHPLQQIRFIKKVLKKVGLRRALIVSSTSGYLAAGHGTLLALKELGVKKIPIVKQSFDSEFEEFNFMTADNETARHSYLDKNAFFEDLDAFQEEGLDFDMEDFGMVNFFNEDTEVENVEGQTEDSNEKEKGRAETKKIKCPSCGAEISL